MQRMFKAKCELLYINFIFSINVLVTTLTINEKVSKTSQYYKMSISLSSYLPKKKVKGPHPPN